MPKVLGSTPSTVVKQFNVTYKTKEKKKKKKDCFWSSFGFYFINLKVTYIITYMHDCVCVHMCPYVPQCVQRDQEDNFVKSGFSFQLCKSFAEIQVTRLLE